MITASINPRANAILALLGDRAWTTLAPALSPVTLGFGTVLHEAGALQSHVYFPVSGVVSIVYPWSDGRFAEIALVGRDGIVGLAAMLGGQRSTTRAMVQVAGTAFRAPARIACALLEQGDARDLLLRHAQFCIAQMTQTAVCGRHHPIPQQLCRWILATADLVGGNEVDMTQELMARMLGVRREGISRICKHLRDAGIIDYSRGHLRILDRRALEQLACECHSIVRSERARLLQRPRPEPARPSRRNAR